MSNILLNNNDNKLFIIENDMPYLNDNKYNVLNGPMSNDMEIKYPKTKSKTFFKELY